MWWDFQRSLRLLWAWNYRYQGTYWKISFYCISNELSYLWQYVDKTFQFLEKQKRPNSKKHKKEVPRLLWQFQTRRVKCKPRILIWKCHGDGRVFNWRRSFRLDVWRKGNNCFFTRVRIYEKRSLNFLLPKGFDFRCHSRELQSCRFIFE